ncbi:MAG TPA: glycoside hydrolase family 76 protein [Chthonomonadaceae bacterium]|nr:glycoside hydrolase family 76 protein [Chthonomonadaceae bacterium]
MSRYALPLVRTIIAALALAATLAQGQTPPPAAAGQSDSYRDRAKAAAAVLHGWYDPERGTWRTTGWWNSANALEAIVDYTAQTRDRTYLPDIANTFEKHQAGHFLNKYYDDEGWWALAWVKAYDLTREPRYLDMAKAIFEDMKGGWDDTFGGGIWWSKDRKYKNAIANELFFTLAARLHRRTPGDGGSGSYLEWAQKSWDWFAASGMINAQSLINDGLNSQGRNNGGTTWTYNQGVILGGLIDLYEITRKKAYLEQAQRTADAAMHALSGADGILVEPCEAKGDCGGDGPQFKGIFVRYLGQLYGQTHARAYADFLRRNADSAWTKDRNEAGQFGLRWAGPFDKADASRQTVALDLFLAAAR